MPGKRRVIWGWMFFDWANQPFHTLILTFTFAPYFVSKVATDPAQGQAAWGYAISIGSLVIALMAPVFGAVLSDKNGLMCRWGIHSFTRCKTPSAISTVRQRSSGSR